MNTAKKHSMVNRTAFGIFLSVLFVMMGVDLWPHPRTMQTPLSLPAPAAPSLRAHPQPAVAGLPLAATRSAPVLMGRACVALAVYVEAPHAGWLEQATIASTVINAARAHHQASPCQAIRQPGLVPGIAAYLDDTPPWRAHPQRWMHAMDVADSVLSDDYSFGTRGCTTTTRMLPSRAPRPAWARSMRMTCRVGQHLFFTPAIPPVVAVAQRTPPPTNGQSMNAACM